MNCPSCSAENPEGARFCSTCGHSLTGRAEERRVVSVLFADLVGFTSLSEHRDPEVVTRVVDGAFERLVADVGTFGGQVDKIVGDAVVALFGAPVAHEDDAERAVRAALAMQETLAAYCAGADLDIRMRVGVNTGEVLVGALRAGGDYTAMGDVVNLASRLQTAASPGEVVVGDATHAATRESIAYEERGWVTARGREQAERAWAATGTLRPPGPRRGSASAPLVGRDAELAVLLNAARGSVRHGRAQLVLLVGEAGVGKTRLASEMAEVLRVEDGLVVLQGRCLPYGEVNPWWPVAEVLRRALDLEAGSSPERARAVVEASVEGAFGEGDDQVPAVVDGMLHILGHEGALRGLDGSAAHSEAVSALLVFLEARLEHGPLLIRLADLHWADEAVFELIDEVTTRLARHPLVLVGTARRSIQARWTPRPGRANHLVLNVDPLDRQSLSGLLDLLTHGSLRGEAASQLLDRSGGNPFYLEELVTLVLGDDGAPAAGDRPLPETLRGLVAARIDALSPEEQAVLGEASIWGTSGSTAVLDRISDAARGVPSVGSEVASLAEKDVLVLDGNRWSFRSDLVREVTYARLTKSARLRGHAGIAEYLDRVVAATSADEATVEVVARHFSEAAELAADVAHTAAHHRLLDRALHWLAEASRRAEAGGAWPLVARLCTRMLELDGGDPEVRLEALLGRSQALAEQWDQEGALTDARAALALADRLGSPSRRATALRRLAAGHMRAGDWPAADGALAEALDIHDSVGDTPGRAETLRQQGLSLLLRGDHRAAEAPIQAALDAFRSVRDRRGEGWALQSLAWIAFGDGRHEAATTYVEASATALGEAGDRGGLQWTNGLEAFLRLARGEFESAARLAGNVLVESERRADRFGTGMMHVALGGAELWTGHPGAAVVSAERALECLDERTDVVGEEQALALRGRALAMSGRPGEGFESIRRSMEVGRGTSMDVAGLVALLTEVQLGLPGRLLHAGGGDRALPGHASGDVALWHLQRGEVDRAREVLAEAMPDLSGSLPPAEDGSVQGGAADRVSLALASAALGRPDDARALVSGVASMDHASYHDRVLAGVVEGLLDHSGGGAEALEAARDMVRGTEDVATSALVDLAAAVRTRRGGTGAQVSMESADASLAATGLSGTRWREMFIAVTDNAPAPDVR